MPKRNAKRGAKKRVAKRKAPKRKAGAIKRRKGNKRKKAAGLENERKTVSVWTLLKRLFGGIGRRKAKGKSMGVGGRHLN